jgi:hypothetical protein
MSLSDPFEVEAEASPPGDEETPKCGVLLPVPPDAPRGTKPEKCGADAPFVIRVRDKTTFAEVPACTKCKAVHDEKAASLRHNRSRTNLPKTA